MKIGIIGNGNVGQRLRQLLTHGGHEVRNGVHDASADESGYQEAAEYGEVVVLAVPFAALETVLPPLEEALVDKVVIDATNPLNSDWSPVVLEGGVSGGEVVQKRLPRSRVVKAFNTIFADSMRRRDLGSGQPPTTAFFCGEDAGARASVARILQDIGLQAADAGPITCARYLEAMAHLNIQMAVAMGGGTEAVFSYHRPTDFESAR